MGKPIKLGEVSGALTVLRRGEVRADVVLPSVFTLHCHCADCGREAEITSCAFRRRRSCVDCSRIRQAQLRTKHGGSIRGSKERLYGAWQQMNNRCNNPRSSSYEWYGAKGIRVCEEWRDFASFRDWAMKHGYGPGMTLDRLDETKGYEPGNCEYVTKPENSRRMRKKYVFVKKSDQPIPRAYPYYDEPTYGDY